MYKILLYRFNFELISHTKKISKFLDLKSYPYKFCKVWHHIFQLEAIRSAQFDKLILTKDRFSLIPKELFIFIKFLELSDYSKYLLSLQFFKMQNLLKSMTLDFGYYFRCPVLSLDLQLNNFFLKSKKKLLLIYNISYWEIHSNNVSLKEKSVFHPSIYSLSLYEKDYHLLAKSFKLDIFNKNLMFELYISIDFCLNKFRKLGIFHLTKKRPVGSSKFLALEDREIMRKFSSIANILRDWFRCCYDVYKIKTLFGVLKESCLLTLCRKHNKRKSWAYNIYSSDVHLISSAACF